MKRKQLSKEDRLKVYEKYNGHCAYCGIKLEYKDMQIDHLVSFFKGNHKLVDEKEIETFDNYMPSCRMCNFYKRAGGIETMRKNIKRLYIQLERDFDYRLAKRYSLIEETPKEIKFFFEDYNKGDN